MTQEKMMSLVPEKLKQIEKEYGVKVLYAVESGSRAWGCASVDSDFDVRFIYMRTPDDYLRLDAVRDVIEIPIDDTWDVSGWDLSKTLRLLHNSNPGLYDWFGSPICYLKTGFEKRIEPLLQACFSKNRMLYHYYHIAAKRNNEILKSNSVRAKQYFYALRAILSCLWIAEKSAPPPVVFQDMESMVPAALREAVAHILEVKANASEKFCLERVEDIDTFLMQSLAEIENMLQNLPQEKPADWKALNAFFLEEIKNNSGEE